MKKIFVGGLLVCSMFFTGCQTAGTPTPQTEKAPVTILIGTLSKSGDQFVLREKTGKTTSIASYTLTFDQYVGKNITVSGQYSGTTLYADTVSLAQ